jgi:hypothetical protein
VTLSRQAQQVLEMLRANTSVSSVEAEMCLKVRRTASRIHDLRKAGFEIKSVTCRDHTGQRYVRYWLLNSPINTRRIAA